MSHRHRHYLTSIILALGLATAGGCAGAARGPGFQVIGVSNTSAPAEQPTLLVFVEVTNPTQRNITLSRLEYHLEASPYFATTGKLTIARSLSPGASTVLEIPVRVDTLDRLQAETGDVPYQLEGRIFAADGTREAEWRVHADGALSPQRPRPRSAGLSLPQPRRM